MHNILSPIIQTQDGQRTPTLVQRPMLNSRRSLTLYHLSIGFQTFISYHRAHLAKQISSRELLRLKTEVYSLNFVDVPIDIAFRRYSLRFGSPWAKGARFISSYFSTSYYRANSDTFPSAGEVYTIAKTAVEIDDWLQRYDEGKLDYALFTCQREVVWCASLFEACENRYENLHSRFEELVPGCLTLDQVAQLFQRLREAPLAERKQPASLIRRTGIEDGFVRLPQVLIDRIGLPDPVCGFWALIGTPSSRGRQILDYLGTVCELDELVWAALLKEVEVLWL